MCLTGDFVPHDYLYTDYQLATHQKIKMKKITEKNEKFNEKNERMKQNCNKRSLYDNRIEG